LSLRRSNFELETPILFERQPDIEVSAAGSLTLNVAVGDYFTISTVRTARHGSFEADATAGATAAAATVGATAAAAAAAAAAAGGLAAAAAAGAAVPSSEPEFPLPYRNDFEGEAISQQPRFFSQMIGAFEVGIRPSFVSSESFLSSKFRTKDSRVVKTGLGHRRRRKLESIRGKLFGRW
jgi:hypothetical protein